MKTKQEIYPVICAWCGVTIKTSTIDHSHGICKDYMKKELKKLDK